MTNKTDNRNYNVPEAGQVNWAEPVNENWERIDADVQAIIDTAQEVLDAATGDNGDDES